MKILHFGDGPYTCQFEPPTCKISGPADKMWNVGGTTVVLCSQHAHAAREHGKKTYRISETIAFQQKMLEEKTQEKKMREAHFFASIDEMAHGPQKKRDHKKR